MAVSPSFLKDFEIFMAGVANAQAALDALTCRISPAMEKQMREFAADHARATAMLEPHLRGIAAIKPLAGLPILSPAAIRRLANRPHDEQPPARSIVRRALKRRIGFTAERQ
jgi:hypothetical protein